MQEINLHLFRAAARGSLSHALLAIEAGADINAHDYNDHTALYIARSRNHTELANQLAGLGAESSLADIRCTNHRNSSTHRAVNPQCRSQKRCKEIGQNIEAALQSNFPPAVVSALMRSEPVSPVSKPSVSIVFLEVVDYTDMRGSMDPASLCSQLERLFRALDALAALHRVERIDAIDGCYIAAANYSAAQPADHAVRLALFAATTVACAAELVADPRRPELGPVRLRGGMHCGAVCGSVVGAHGGRKHTLHGDAVNVGSARALPSRARQGSARRVGCVRRAEMCGKCGE